MLPIGCASASCAATGIESFEVRDGAALEQRIGEADVLVISGLWRNDLLPRAKRRRFIQSIGAGTDQFSREALKQNGVRLASAGGVNARAVSEHVMALILAFARRLPRRPHLRARVSCSAASVSTASVPVSAIPPRPGPGKECPSLSVLGAKCKAVWVSR